ncbi:hypothetical protein ACFQX7_12905 [Luedemannella flava]
MIRDSSDPMADRIWSAGGEEQTIARLARVCGLPDAAPFTDMWSQTYVSARDLARLADCIADGTAAGPTWTDWLLNEMRHVRGEGDFGIAHALPEADRATVAVKNGWYLHTGDRWQVNCMAVTDGWSLAVLLNYPGPRGLRYGDRICREVTRQLLPTIRHLRR